MQHTPNSNEKMTPQEVLSLFFSSGVELYDMPEEGGKRVVTTIPTHVQCVDVVNGNTDLVQLGFPPDMVENGNNSFRASEKLIHVQSHTYWLIVYARPASTIVEIRPFSLPAAVISKGDDFVWFKTVLHDGVQPKEYVDTVYPTTPDNGEPYKPVNFFPPGEGYRSIPNPDYVPKPVVGAMPQWRWIELRVDHLQEAIQRYKDASQSVPVDIEAELTEHQVWLKQYGPK